MNAANDPNFRRQGPATASVILAPLAAGMLTAVATVKLLWHDALQIFMPLPSIPLTDHLTHWIYGVLALMSP